MRERGRKEVKARGRTPSTESWQTEHLPGEHICNEAVAIGSLCRIRVNPRPDCVVLCHDTELRAFFFIEAIALDEKRQQGSQLNEQRKKKKEPSVVKVHAYT